MSDLLFGALAGDMGALSVLFVLMLPFILVYAAVASIVGKVRDR